MSEASKKRAGLINIKCCKCEEWTLDVEHLKHGYLTASSGFKKPASECCDNCGHIFCPKCRKKGYELGKNE